MPFGSPVVPDVKAIRQTSSAAVSTAVELEPGLRHQRFERIGPPAAPVDDALEPGQTRLRLLHLVGELRVAERDRDPRLVDRVGDLLGAQQRHRGDHDAAGLQPAR